MDNVKKVILTSMSTKPGGVGQPAYYYDDNNQYCWGISQLEAGTKHFLSLIGNIDIIIAVGSDQTIGNEQEKSEDSIDLNMDIDKSEYVDIGQIKETIDSYSAYGFYKYRIMQFIEGFDKELLFYRTAAKNKNTEIVHNKDFIAGKYKQNFKPMKILKSNKNVHLSFVPLIRNGVDNIKEIVDKIRGVKEADDDKIYLYVDVQGGQRTDMTIRNAVLSILSHGYDRDIIIKEVVGTNWDISRERNESHPAHEIVDETKRYQINDLVAGMNAFLQYGKADLIKRYCDEQKIFDKNVLELVDIMQSIDDSLSLCDVTRLRENIQSLKAYFISLSADDLTKLAKINSVLDIMREEIQSQYHSLISTDEIDTITLVKWAFDNKFYQQAITIIESLMPTDFVKYGIAYYGNDSESKDKFSELLYDLKHEKSGLQNYLFEDVNHMFIKNLNSITTYTYRDDKQTNDKNGYDQRAKAHLHELIDIINGDLKKDVKIKIYSKVTVKQIEEIQIPTKNSPFEIYGERLNYYKNHSASLHALMYCYYYLSAIRNDNNHALVNKVRLRTDEIAEMISDFIDMYQTAVEETDGFINNYMIEQKDFIANDPYTHYIEMIRDFENALSAGEEDQFFKDNTELINRYSIGPVLRDIEQLNIEFSAINNKKGWAEFLDCHSALKNVVDYNIKTHNKNKKNKWSIGLFLKNNGGNPIEAALNALRPYYIMKALLNQTLVLNSEQQQGNVGEAPCR